MERYGERYGVKGKDMGVKSLLLYMWGRSAGVLPGLREEPPSYWCEICGQVVTDKRCPLCGLKTRKIRMEGGEKKGKKRA